MVFTLTAERPMSCSRWRAGSGVPVPRPGGGAGPPIPACERVGVKKAVRSWDVLARPGSCRPT